jgi:hypothetical protein
VDDGRKPTASPAGQTAGRPDDFWFQQFQKKKPSASDVEKLVSRFHKARRHDQVIGVLSGSLAAGVSEPWMYRVLALSMKIEGYPREDIERALLSQVDFTISDLPSLLSSIDVLVSLDGAEQALILCRQASELDPVHPVPYLRGLKLARELKDDEALEWACTGLLSHEWLEGDASHRLAEDAAVERSRELKKEGREPGAARLTAAVAEARRRDLTIRVDWSGKGDLDLEVFEPLGTVCSVTSRLSSGGGVLTHDGFGPRPENCFDEYVCAQGISGDYRLKVSLSSGTVVGRRCRVTITQHQGSKAEVTRTLTLTLDGDSVEQTVTLKDGRRVAPGRPTSEFRANPRLPSRSELLAQLRQAAPPRVAPPGNRLPVGAVSVGVGYQPVVSTVSDGVALSAMAVVSPDLRFVRIAVSPVFNALTEVQTFSFITP